MTFRRLIALLTVVITLAMAGCEALAQGAFPAPLPGQAGQANDPAIPPVNGSSPAANVGTPPVGLFPSKGATPVAGGDAAAALPSQAETSDECMKEFRPLREEAEKRGQLIKAASDRHAPADETCKLIGNFGQAEIKMIKYVESHATNCGVPTQVEDQLKNGHKNSEALQKKVCALAQHMQMRGPAGPTGDFDPPILR
jgi:hypothetical protein